jgi:hypothetical protein
MMARATKKKQNHIWNEGRGDFFLRIPDRLWDALDAAGVSPRAQLMLRGLYVFIRIAEWKGQPITASGEMFVYPHQATLARERRVTVKTVQNLLKELESIGAIRRERARGSANIMWVLVPRRLVSRLLEDVSVRKNLKAMQPRGYGDLQISPELGSCNGEFL